MFWKYFSKFTGEHLCWSAISVRNFIEIALRHGYFPVNLFHTFRTPFLKNTSGRLPLPIRDKISKLDNPNFYFEYTFFDQTLKELEKLDPKKTSQLDDIPLKVIKENEDIVAFFIHRNFSNLLSSSTFPTALKYADVKPVFKKDDKTDTENYRPISILPTLSKLYERLIYNQMYRYFDKLFSKFQCGFRKGFNAQHCLITIIEKWRRSVSRWRWSGRCSSNSCF